VSTMTLAGSPSAGNQICHGWLKPTIALLLCTLLAGCAGSASTPQLSGPPTSSFDATTASIGPVSAEAAPDVNMTPADLDRIEALVQADLYKAYSARIVPAYALIKPGEVKVDMNFITYDKGNAFARAMLAGLGQIHIVANVRLIDAASGNVAASYDVSKTFAWGGLYGASTSIEDVETGFAASVVDIFKKK
jgi:hypothetical protein